MTTPSQFLFFAFPPMIRCYFGSRSCKSNPGIFSSQDPKFVFPFSQFLLANGCVMKWSRNNPPMVTNDEFSAFIFRVKTTHWDLLIVNLRFQFLLQFIPTRSQVNVIHA